MSKEYTHTGYVAGRGLARSGNVTLRETGTFWITPSNIKFRKADGTEARCDWPTFTLRLDTIKPITQ